MPSELAGRLQPGENILRLFLPGAPAGPVLSEAVANFIEEGNFSS
jgi:hypothetical protein